MSNFEIIKTHLPDFKSFRVCSILGTFDLPKEEITERFSGEITLDDNWQIGVIYGTSGSGKSTIAKSIFEKNYFYNPNFKSNSVIDDMPKECSMNEISKMFVSVGFGSVPSWLKPYSVLSNGEKMRVSLAYALLDNKSIIVFDEFTSVVDRNVAKVGSLCVQRTVRNSEKKFVAVTCHEDVINWLMPDWVFCTNDMQMKEIKKKDLNLNWSFLNVKEKCGECLKSIII